MGAGQQIILKIMKKSFIPIISHYAEEGNASAIQTLQKMRQ